MTDAATDFHYFSNGTEWDIWSQVWCYQCAKDHVSHNPDGDLAEGCPLIVEAMMHREVKEWTDTSGELDQYPSVVCSAFEQCAAPECNSDEVRDGVTYVEWCANVRTKMQPAQVNPQN